MMKRKLMKNQIDVNFHQTLKQVFEILKKEDQTATRSTLLHRVFVPFHCLKKFRDKQVRSKLKIKTNR